MQGLDECIQWEMLKLHPQILSDSVGKVEVIIRYVANVVPCAVRSNVYRVGTILVRQSRVMQVDFGERQFLERPDC